MLQKWFFQLLNNLFYAGDFVKAMHLYEHLIDYQPELSHVFIFNLNLARKRLSLPPIIDLSGSTVSNENDACRAESRTLTMTSPTDAIFF